MQKIIKEEEEVKEVEEVEKVKEVKEVNEVKKAPLRMWLHIKDMLQTMQTQKDHYNGFGNNGFNSTKHHNAYYNLKKSIGALSFILFHHIGSKNRKISNFHSIYLFIYLFIYIST